MSSDDKPTSQDNVVELPTLDARYLEVIHAVMGAALLDSLTLHASLVAKSWTRPQPVSEKFLRKLSIELVKRAREIYNEPHEDRTARFQSIIEYVSSEMHSLAGIMLEEQAKEEAKKPVILDSSGRRIRRK